MGAARQARYQRLAVCADTPSSRATCACVAPWSAEPIGHPGIRRFTQDLHSAWRFPYDTGFGPVDDCYALNVTGETAWACYSSAFPIVRIGPHA